MRTAYDDAVEAVDESSRVGAAARLMAMERARMLLAPTMAAPAPAYPIEALGPLAGACRAISEHGQVRPAMAGQCLLGAASLLTQGLFNVETQHGSKKPLSLNLLTLGASGDGKSLAQGVALHPVTEWQRKVGDEYRRDLSEYEREKSSRKSGNKDGAGTELPTSPYRIARDSTVEGLRRDLDTGVCSQGIFTDEAAAILSGYGMTVENRSKTAGVFSGLFDNGHLSVSRITGGRVERYGRRIALHWLIQPAGAAQTLGDKLLSQLGFWPRFLVAWPEELEPRKDRAFNPATMPEIERYWDRCVKLLAYQLPDDADTCVAIPMMADARNAVGQAFERFEVASRRGDLRVIKPFALRATEQICRVAGVLTAFAGEDAVSLKSAQNAMQLVMHSMHVWKSIVEGGVSEHGGHAALDLYGWLYDRPKRRCSIADITRLGPQLVRSKESRDDAINLLLDADLVDTYDKALRAKVD
jgi:hypothetical protein